MSRLNVSNVTRLKEPRKRQTRTVRITTDYLDGTIGTWYSKLTEYDEFGNAVPVDVLTRYDEAERAWHAAQRELAQYDGTANKRRNRRYVPDEPEEEE